FVSFGPGATLPQRYSRVYGVGPNHIFDTAISAVEALLAASAEHSVNVRSFDPNQPQAHEFLYGLKSATDVVDALRMLAGSGLHTIVNETIDVNDGGVSGVALGDIVEFAPGDTPRAVEKPGTVAFPRDQGVRVLEIV